jgi:hypothetical protein
MSYRRAWLLVEEINNALREPAVTAETGGRSGGGDGAHGRGRTGHRSLSIDRNACTVGDGRRFPCHRQARSARRKLRPDALLSVAVAAVVALVALLTAATAREVIDPAGRKVEVPDCIDGSWRRAACIRAGLHAGAGEDDRLESETAGG